MISGRPAGGRRPNTALGRRDLADNESQGSKVTPADEAYLFLQELIFYPNLDFFSSNKNTETKIA